VVADLRFQLRQLWRKRRLGDGLLFSVTAVELALLIYQTPSFELIDWIYVSQHLIVLGLSFTRRAPATYDYSLRSSIAVAVSYGYPYAETLSLGWWPGWEVSAMAGLVLVMAATFLSFVSLVSLGRSFGVRPALRRLVTFGPYRFVRHPIYLSYVMSDIGYNIQEWNVGTLLLTFAGWISLLYRIHAEERVLSRDPRWPAYVATVRYRLLPGIW
jgi:protein-S-isoprenylcysteine O-methyltransferase Ste14